MTRGPAAGGRLLAGDVSGERAAIGRPYRAR
ncbi:hypothetical protein AB0C13_39150, partial [Streptomyces sp. NPDC049099]